MSTYEGSMEDQLRRFYRLWPAKNESGETVYVCSGYEATNMDLEEARKEAYLRALEQLLVLLYPDGVEVKRDRKWDAKRSDVITTYRAVSDFQLMMKLVSAVKITEEERSSDFRVHAHPFPVSAVETVMELVQEQRDGVFRVICRLAIDRFWADPLAYEIR